MNSHTTILWNLIQQILPPAEIENLRELVTCRFDLSRLATFDEAMGGPSITTMNCNNSGRYDIADRDVFRPLQYCMAYFDVGTRDADLDWRTRDIIQMSSLHIESLIKRVGKIGSLPLGAALGKAVVRTKVDSLTYSVINQFVAIYNASKHDVSQPKDTHMFSVEDAVLAYVLCRRLGMRLYPLASLLTDLTIFDSRCVGK